MSKSINKIIKIIFCVITYLFFAVLMSLASSNTGEALFSYIPIPGAVTGVLILFVIVIIAAIVGVLVGTLLSDLFLTIHHKFLGKKLDYSIQEIPNPNYETKIMSALFPTLMAISVGISICKNSTMQNLVLTDYARTSPGMFSADLMTSIGVLPLTVFLGFLIFVPIWVILKSGIVFSNKPKVEKKGLPVETMSVGTWFIYLLKGYAGFGALTGFISFTSDTLGDTSTDPLSLALFYIVPVLILAFTMPALLLYEQLQKGRVKSLHETARKLGISDL